MNTQEAVSKLLAASGAVLASWLEGLTPEQLSKFDSLLAAGGSPGADVLLAATGPTVALYIAAPDGTRHPLVRATVAPPIH